MADVAVQNLTVFEPVTPAYVAAAAGQTIPTLTDDQKLLLRFKNGSGADVDVTVDDKNTPAIPGAVAFDADFLVTIPANGEAEVLISDLGRFKDSATGKISLSFESLTSVTWGVFRIR